MNLSYDYENRLIQGLSPTGTVPEVNYAYSGDGRRISSKSGTTTINYLYDGLDVVLERNASGSVLASYLRNPGARGGIGGIISSQGLSKGTVPETYYSYDGIGSVANLSNTSGANITSFSYDAFGNLLTSPNANNSRQFLTKEQDSTGFIYFGARYYDPRIGRFITQDPLGMVDGTNMYLYCGNDPVNWVDLWGRCKKATAKFEWNDISSWFFPGTNYCGITKSGPGLPTSIIDAHCQIHDNVIRNEGTVWWNIFNRNIVNAHLDLIETLCNPESYNNNYTNSEE